MSSQHKGTGKIGKKGVYTIPAAMHRRLGLTGGPIVIAEELDKGVVVRPDVVPAVENSSDEHTAEFLLSTAADAADYEAARAEVKAIGVDPDSIPHHKPAA